MSFVPTTSKKTRSGYLLAKVKAENPNLSSLEEIGKEPALRWQDVDLAIKTM